MPFVEKELWMPCCMVFYVIVPPTIVSPHSVASTHFSSNNSEIVAKHTPDERLVSRIYKEYLQPNSKKTNKKWAKI